jgi:hypothetical protein
MDACVAFSYALSSETTKKYAGSKILAQETQVRNGIILHSILLYPALRLFGCYYVF